MISEPYAICRDVKWQTISMHLTAEDGENNRGTTAATYFSGGSFIYTEVDVLSAHLLDA